VRHRTWRRVRCHLAAQPLGIASKSGTRAAPYPVSDMQEGLEQEDDRREAAAKATGDLHAIVEAVLKSLPPSKPWQRQLLQHLHEIDRTIKVLRMTIALERVPSEVTDAKEQVLLTLRVANRYVAMGRADFGTKAAVRLAYEIGQRIDVTVA
jgi:hypothetical protein